MNELNNTDFISFDPGSSSTGVAEWSYAEAAATGRFNVAQEFDYDDLIEYLEEMEELPKEILIEEYRVDPSVPHHHSKVETIQVIGAIKAWAYRNKIPYVEQSRTILPIAEKWSGWKTKKKHRPDWLSAALHGYYYLHHNKKIIPARVFLIKEKESKK